MTVLLLEPDRNVRLGVIEDHAHGVGITGADSSRLLQKLLPLGNSPTGLRLIISSDLHTPIIPREGE